MPFWRKPPGLTSRVDICMNTAVTQTVYGVDSARAALVAVREIQRLEDLLSRFRPDSDIGRLNTTRRPRPVRMHRDTVHVLAAALAISSLSDGAFDITAAPLVSLWSVTSADARIPTEDAIAQARALVDYRGLVVNQENRSAYLSGERQMVDLGGIAKGYAADRALHVLKRRGGISSAMVDLGGNVAVLGNKEDGTPWRVGIQDPDAARGECLGFLSLQDESAVTSGDYERFFEAGGKRYHHIIDPRTGYPVESGLRSVTVVSDSSMIADGLSTALFALGMENGLNMLQRLHERGELGFGPVEALFVTSDRQVHLTQGLVESYTPTPTPARSEASRR